MSGACDRAAELEGRLACCVREGERGRERLADSAATYRGSFVNAFRHYTDVGVRRRMQGACPPLSLGHVV